jgi:hypothetical protein
MNCQYCNKPISYEISRSSMNIYRKLLCIGCQVLETKKTYAKQPVLMERRLKELSKYIVS